MTNHFTLSDATFQSSKALCPWKDEDDEAYFADVDGTQNAFEHYAELAKRQVHLAGGSFHLVVGPEGCGKTSLINRCAAHYREVNNSTSDQGRATIIIDVSKDVPASVAVKQKPEEVWQIVMDELVEHVPILTTDQVGKITNDSLAFGSSLRQLSRCLAKNGSSLAIILPQIELDKEVDAYFDLVKNNVALFAECTDERVAEYCNRVYGSKSDVQAQVMRLKPLAVEDGKTFVANRLTRRTEDCPSIEAEVVDQMMATRVGEGTSTNIRELHLVCEAVYEGVLKRGGNSVQYEDFSDLYLKKATYP